MNVSWTVHGMTGNLCDTLDEVRRKVYSGIKNMAHPFPLHLSSLNFLDDVSRRSANAGENGRISGRRKNKKRPK